MRRLFAIGDIHGHHTELMNLYQQLDDAGMRPERDQLVFIGDFIDGGPDSKKVLDQLIAWQEAYPHWVFLRGNHGQMMLDALNDPGNWRTFDLWYNQGGESTAKSYLPEDLTPYERATATPWKFIDSKHVEWIQQLPYIYEHPTFFFVHAGLNPNYPLNEQTIQDLLWIRGEFYNSRHDFGKPVVFGHTTFNEPLVQRVLVSPEAVKPISCIGIDTMFLNSGKLTAVELDPTNPHIYPRFFFSHSVASESKQLQRR